MAEVKDYTIHNGIGIRIWEKNRCRVIRLVRGAWVEIGAEYPIPVEETALVWTGTGIPATMLAVALRLCELDYPDAGLRRLLSGKATPSLRRTRPSVREPASARRFETASTAKFAFPKSSSVR